LDISVIGQLVLDTTGIGHNWYWTTGIGQNWYWTTGIGQKHFLLFQVTFADARETTQDAWV
jgi:hypothetical protein